MAKKRLGRPEVEPPKTAPVDRASLVSWLEETVAWLRWALAEADSRLPPKGSRKTTKSSRLTGFHRIVNLPVFVESYRAAYQHSREFATDCLGCFPVDHNGMLDTFELETFGREWVAANTIVERLEAAYNVSQPKNKRSGPTGWRKGAYDVIRDLERKGFDDERIASKLRQRFGSKCENITFRHVQQIRSDYRPGGRRSKGKH